MTDTTPCPCGSGLAYADCCEPYIRGTARPPDPEALMRSRYSAYTLHEMNYLADTLHPGQRHDYDEAGAAKWAQFPMSLENLRPGLICCVVLDAGSVSQAAPTTPLPW